MVNLFKWGPQVSENFSDSLETKDPLTNLEGEQITPDGWWMYGKFERPKTPTDPLEDVDESGWILDVLDEEEPNNGNSGNEIADPFGSIDDSSLSSNNLNGAENLDNSNNKNEITDPFGDIENNDWALNQSDWTEVLNNSNGITQTTEDLLASTNLDGLSEEKLLERQENLKNKSKNLDTLIRDIETIKNLDSLYSLDIDLATEEKSFNSEVLNKIWWNYLKTPLENWEFDLEADFSMAILETKAEIIDECANIKMDSETYKVAIRNIESGDIKRQLEWIESLYYLAYSNEWKLWKASLDKFKNKKKQRLIDEGRKIDEKLQLAINQKNEKELLNKRKQEIIMELSEMTWIKDWEKVEWWDVFTASMNEQNERGSLEKEGQA